MQMRKQFQRKIRFVFNEIQIDYGGLICEQKSQTFNKKTWLKRFDHFQLYRHKMIIFFFKINDKKKMMSHLIPMELSLKLKEVVKHHFSKIYAMQQSPTLKVQKNQRSCFFYDCFQSSDSIFNNRYPFFQPTHFFSYQPTPT